MAVVTGSSSGIGRAIALELARAGADVVVHANRSTAAAADVAQEIERGGRRSKVVLADLSRRDALGAFVEESFGALGSADIWVNNAGADILTGSGSRRSFEEKLDTLLAVDLVATVHLSRDVGSRMKANRGGVILNMGWDQAERGMEGESGELFATAKGAVMCFTRSLALSLAPDVRVNCLAPGWIRTAWGRDATPEWEARAIQETPAGRWGEPEDVAALARFLVSPAASFLTGQTVRANGGAVR